MQFFNPINSVTSGPTTPGTTTPTTLLTEHRWYNRSLLSALTIQTIRKALNRLPVLAALALSTAAFAQKTPPDPGNGGTVGGFEVDADFISGTVPGFWNSGNYANYGTYGDDWSQGTTFSAVLKQVAGVSVPGLTTDGKSLWKVDGNWGNASAVPEVQSFAGNSNKNGDNIQLAVKPYSLQLGGTGPQKNDITQSFLHTRTVSGDIWLFFGAETRATSGSSYIDFEYNQHGVTVTNSQLYGPVNNTGSNIVGGRTINDFIIVVNYTGGGAKPVVGVRKWLANGTWSAELPLTAGQSYMTTNIAAVSPVAPNKAFATNGAYANQTGALQFVEGGVNITALNLLLDVCTPEATVTVKTRSSPSFTAELKDLDILPFALTPSATAAVPAVPSQCIDASGTTRFHVTGTYTNGTPNFTATGGTIVAGSQTYADGTVEADVDVTGSGSEICTVLLTVTTPVASCPEATASIKLSVSPRPNAPVLSIVNPDCNRAMLEINVISPRGAYEYSNQGGAWQTDTLFNVAPGTGYSIVVRSTADPACVSAAAECPAPSARLMPAKTTPVKLNKTTEGELSIYPNPFTMNCTIEFKAPKAGRAELSVFDLNGRLVKQAYTAQVNAGETYRTTLDGSQYPDGIYIARFTLNGKLIKSARIVHRK
jgi:hypothetical protein